MKFTIKASIYPYTINVFIGSASQAVDYINKVQKRQGSDKYQVSHFDCFGRFCPHENTPVIWMPSKPKTARQLCTVSHEILHAVFDAMEWVGIKYSRKSEEAYTYLHVHFMEQFLNKCGIK